MSNKAGIITVIFIILLSLSYLNADSSKEIATVRSVFPKTDSALEEFSEVQEQSVETSELVVEAIDEEVLKELYKEKGSYKLPEEIASSIGNRTEWQVSANVIDISEEDSGEPVSYSVMYTLSSPS